MGHYIKYNKNYWDRKIFNENSKFDTEILKHQSIELKKSQDLFKKYVELVCLEMSYYCNRACSYCPVAIYERSDKNLEIDDELFLSIINSLKKIDYAGRISLNLFNEPLASKNFLERVKKLKNNLPNAILSCNSNGDYIKNLDTFTKLDESGLKEILITLHPAKNMPWTKSYAQKSITRFAKKINYSLTKIELEKLKFSFMINKLYVEIVCTNWDNSGNSRG